MDLPSRLTSFWKRRYEEDVRIRKSIDRFFSYLIIETEVQCYGWRGSFKNNGSGQRYTQLEFLKKKHTGHRLSFRLFRGKIPEGLFVLHECDNPGCVNPKHLKLGDHNENMADVRNRKRAQSGENHWTRRVPDAVSKGENHYTKKRPWLILRGKERAASCVRGDEHWTRKHPEKLLRGENHYFHQHPELIMGGRASEYGKKNVARNLGENNPGALLTNEQAKLIRELYATGKYTQQEIGERFGVSQVTVSQIVLGKIYNGFSS